MNSIYWVPALIALSFSFILTYFIRKLAISRNWLPQIRKRDVHNKPIPRLGGIAMFLAFVGTILIVWFVNPDLFNFNTSSLNFGFFEINKHLFGILLASTLITTVMIIDDIRGLSPWTKLFWQIIAAIIIIVSGIGIDFIRNPFGGEIHLDQIKIPIEFLGNSYSFTLWSDLFTMIWLVGMMNIINFLDGIDGLAGGVSVIAAMIIFFLSISPGINQIATAVLAITLASSILGFLPFNFPPAKIFMGDTGSMFVGFMLGILAIISGGKVTTAFLVLGFPILDGIWVAISRIRKGKSPFKADQTHFHHRMLNMGLSQQQTVFLLYFIAALFGIIALFSSTEEKLSAIIWLLIIMVVMVVTALWLKKIKKTSTK